MTYFTGLEREWGEVFFSAGQGGWFHFHYFPFFLVSLKHPACLWGEKILEGRKGNFLRRKVCVSGAAGGQAVTGGGQAEDRRTGGGEKPGMSLFIHIYIFINFFMIIYT